MVKPGGTGSPRLAISARLAPLPPSRFLMPAVPSALPRPNLKTRFDSPPLAITPPFATPWGSKPYPRFRIKEDHQGDIAPSPAASATAPITPKRHLQIFPKAYGSLSRP